METKSPSTSKRVPSAKRWGSSGKPISSMTQSSRPAGPEGQDQPSLGQERPKSGRPLSSNVYLKKTIAKGWKAQEVPTEELSPEELDKLVGDEVESLREKKKALQGMLTSQGLGASDQTTQSDWVKGEVQIPDFHCSRCRDHFYGLTDEPCEEELERLVREGLWGEGERAGGDLSPKSRKQRGFSARSPKQKRAVNIDIDSHLENPGSRKGRMSSGVVSRGGGRGGGGAEEAEGSGTENTSHGQAIGVKSRMDTTLDDRNVNGDDSNVDGSLGKRNVKDENRQNDFHVCVQDTNETQNENPLTLEGGDKIGHTGNNVAYSSNSNTAGAYLGDEVGRGGRGDQVERGKGGKRRKVKSGIGASSESESESESSSEEGRLAGGKKKSRNRRDKEASEVGKVLGGTDEGHGVSESINSNTVTRDGMGGGSRLGVSKEGVNATQSVRLEAGSGVEGGVSGRETFRGDGENSNGAALNGEFTNRIESREWEKGVSRYNRKGTDGTDEGLGGGDQKGVRSVLASAGTNRQSEREATNSRKENIRSVSEILSDLLNNKRPSSALPTLHSQFAVSQPYTFSYYNN